MTPPKRAILYARVSTPRQAELYSLDYQIEQEQIYANDTNLRVVAVLRDDTSGRSLDRDGLEEACRMLESDEADVLVTWNFDRLHRSYVNAIVLRERIRKIGKEIHYAKTRTVSGKTARERLPEDLQYILAEIEIDEIMDRLKTGKRNKALAGKWIGLNRPPYGYKTEGHRKDAVPVIHEEHAAVIRKIFDWYVYGDEHGNPMSTRMIADRLTAEGIPTPNESVPTSAHVRKREKGVWARTVISQLMRESSYDGTYYNFKYKYVNTQ